MNRNRSEYMKKYREEHKEEIRKYKKEYAKTHDSSFKKIQIKVKNLENALEESKDNYNCLLKQKEQFEYIMSKQVDYQGQQQKFLKYLDDKIKKNENNHEHLVVDMFGSYDLNEIELNVLEEILQEYKKIIGENKDE